VLAERIGQIQPALVPQPHNQHGDERLGQRADPVLGVAVRLVAVQHAAGPAPGQQAVPHHRAGQRRRPARGLPDGDAVHQRAPGRREERFGRGEAGHA
jgi:hypothetical protein